MDVFTISVPRWRRARNRDIELVDITVKSGNSMFSPTWDMVLGSKAGTLSHEDYERQYRKMMSESWKKHRKEWQAFLEKKEPIALACYCKSDTAYGCFCHRYLLVDLLKELCERQGIDFQYYGELT